MDIEVTTLGVCDWATATLARSITVGAKRANMVIYCTYLEAKKQEVRKARGQASKTFKQPGLCYLPAYICRPACSALSCDWWGAN